MASSLYWYRQDRGWPTNSWSLSALTRRKLRMNVRLENMTCRLCKQQHDLCDSHIIPEFCYKPLYDENHHFINMFDVRNERYNLGQKGFKETLLCRNCETLFNRYEEYCCRRLFKKDLPSPRQGTQRFFDLPNVDSTKLRYFLLSILWRASESNQAMFTNVHLGPKHSERLRSHLLREALPSQDTYGLMVLALHFEEKPMIDIIMQPTFCRIEGHRVYYFVFTGIVFLCFTSSHQVPLLWKRWFIGSTPQTTIYRADLPELKFLSKIWFNE